MKSTYFFLAGTLGLALASSCATSQTVESMQALDECLPGLWVRSVGECNCSLFETSECSVPTCEQAQTAWSVLPDGTMLEFVLRYTTGSQRTFSIVDSPSRGRWEVVDATTLNRAFGMANLGPATCTPSSASWNRIEFMRADAALKTAVEAAWVSGATRSVSY